MQKISKGLAMRIGLISVAVVICFEVFNGLACYHHNLNTQLIAFGFVATGFLPGLAALFSKNPLRTVGAALLFVPWLILAYYTDCVRAYQGGGASMIYIAVVMYGFPSALIGAFVTGPILKFFKIIVSDT